MGTRRMLSREVVERDDFLDLSLSAQALYMHLVLGADDDGFIKNPGAIRRMVGASGQDMQDLIGTGAVLAFEGQRVVAITDWHNQNSIRQDRYKPTECKEALATLTLTANGSYSRHSGYCDTPGAAESARTPGTADTVITPAVAVSTTLAPATMTADNRLATNWQPTGNQCAPDGSPKLSISQDNISQVKLSKVNTNQLARARSATGVDACASGADHFRDATKMIADESAESASASELAEAEDPPTQEAVREYIRQCCPLVDADAFYGYCVTMRWRWKDGTTIRDWRYLARCWQRKAQQPRTAVAAKKVSEQCYTQREYQHSTDALDQMMTEWEARKNEN